MSSLANVLVDLSRVKKFSGTMVLFWPFAWSLTMTARSIHLPGFAFLKFLVQGFVGASLLHRCGGCIWNDILDREVDRKVERTKARPIAAGRISVYGALFFLFVHLVLLVGMIWPVNPLAWKLGLVAIFPLPGIYPLTKRITYWPQAWLGLAMNSGIPMASVLLTGEITRAAGILGVGAWAWTIWYDTIYACQDKKDDVQAGIKSTALLFRDNTKKILAAFGSILVSSLFICGIISRSQVPYFIVAVGGAATYITHQLWKVNLDVPKSCWDTFQRNGFMLGAIVWSGFLIDYLMDSNGVAA